jgi:glycolate oxidase FAD binding subunit
MLRCRRRKTQMTDLPGNLAGVIAGINQTPSPEGLDTQRTIAPQSVEEAADVLGAAAADDVTVGFAGSGSNLELGGLKPYDLGMVSAGIADIIDWQPDDLTVVVGAGVPVGYLEDELASRNQTALLPVVDPMRSVGGVIAEGASAYSRLKYGPTRDRVLEVTLATGYGEAVRGGGRLVKNVTGYDVPRLVTGSMGSLGFIATVCLKLWPLPPLRRAVRVADPAEALSLLFRPVAVLETESGSFAHLEGSEGDIAAQTASVGGDVVGGGHEPPVVDSDVIASIRVAPRSVASVVEAVRAAGSVRWVAQHGVGVIEAGWPELDIEGFGELRRSVESTGGQVVLRRAGSQLGGVDPWGAPAGSQAIQQRMKDLFDPSAVCNPGKLPGGM